MVPSLSLQRVVQKGDRNLARILRFPSLAKLDLLDGNPLCRALPKEIDPQPDKTFGSRCEAVWSAPP